MFFIYAVLLHIIENKSTGNFCRVIVKVSSDERKGGFANLSSYCANKFGIIGLTEMLAKEVIDKV